MAGYSKGIVDTRKLNKDSKAKLGRGGDTKIRKVDNKESHVNALEAYLIDVNGKAGEDYAKRVGAGTVNPFTGMPEYHAKRGAHSHDPAPVEGDTKQAASGGRNQNLVEWTYTGGQWTKTSDLGGDITTEWTAPTGRQDYETLAGMDTGQFESYLQSEFDIGKDKMQYIDGFQQEPFGFLEDAQDIAETGSTSTRDIAQKELGDVRTDTLSGLENLRTDTLSGLQTGYADTMGAFGSQQATLGRQMGRGFGQAAQGAGQATKRSNMAFSGTITQGLERQQKQLFQDYSAGTKDIQRGMQSTTRDLGLGTARAERDYTRGTGIAGRDYTQGMTDTTSAYDLAMRGSTLAFDQGEWLEQQRQMDQMYADVGYAATQ
tara:strand:+ start:1016 stop:2137 length:1122 start_codon:yes stop_codon:yes gene_type:complete